MTWPVAVSGHAIQMAAERAGITRRSAVAELVADALAAGRCSARRPDWLERREGAPALYAWTSEGVVFVLVAQDDHFVVTTCLTTVEVAA